MLRWTDCWVALRTAHASLSPTRCESGRVIAVRRDNVFLEFADRQQGILSLRQFDVPPRPGAVVQVVVGRLDPDDGLYELSLPNRAVQVNDWSDLVEGRWSKFVSPATMPAAWNAK